MTDTLTALTRAQCWRLLTGQRVGRVVYTQAAMPACAPVNFAVYGNSIVFRTTEGSGFAAATRNAVVAFEVDRIDEESRSGWSVLVTGLASPVEDVGVLLRLEQLNLVTWAVGGGSSWVRIVPAVVSGRLLPQAENVPLLAS